MKVVIDTNVLVSAAVCGGHPGIRAGTLPD